MNSILAVEKGLPPGLWLPTPDESTTQYLSENFNHGNHPYENVLDYGSFVVALASFTAEETGRSSLMPTRTDLGELFDAGYGMSPHHHLRKAYGGVSQLQLGLGFYPRGHVPKVEDLMDRMKWMREYAVLQEYTQEEVDRMSFHDLVLWGSSRRFSPDPQIVYEMFDGDTTPIRKYIGMEKRNYRRQYSPNDLFRFGARVIRENDGPLSMDELDANYPDEFVGSTYETIRTVFGTLTNFWLEFGYVTQMRGIEKEDLLNLGVRYAIQHEGTTLHSGQINQLSKNNLFPSRIPIINRFSKISVYREEVEREYQAYLELEKELVSQGVSLDVMRLATRRYIPGPEFSDWLMKNTPSLKLLSELSQDTSYVLKLVKSGFDLGDEGIYEMQLEDMLLALRRIGIKTKNDLGFVLALIPRFDAQSLT